MQLKENGYIEQVTILEDNHSLKIQNLLCEKQIGELIKDINQIQEMCNVFEAENITLRTQLGLEADENVIIDEEFITEGKKQKQLIEKLNLDVQYGNEEKLKLKMEIKNLNKKVGHLTNEILDVPPNSKMMELNRSLKIVKKVGEEHSNDIKALSEENEALRKGLHEILNNIREKSEVSPREIKSEVLEKLLKTLDVKHISGWYHPAMRLQAELHTLEGVNSELREQLHEARNEIENLKILRKEENVTITKDSEIIPLHAGSHSCQENNNIINTILNRNFKSLQDFKIHIFKIIEHLNESNTNAEEILTREFELLQNSMNLIHENCNAEKAQLIELIESQNNTKKEISDEFSLERYTSLNVNEMLDELQKEKSKTLLVVKELNNRKEEVSNLKELMSSLEENQSLQIESMLKKIIFLQSKLRLKEKLCANLPSIQQFRQIEHSLNEQLTKYRKVLTDIEQQNKCRLLEIEILKQKDEDVTNENFELKRKLNQSICNLNQEQFKHDPHCQSLSQKLADAEIQAISEKQRADHTNNLYELVKEQLRKSEEKFIEFSKCGENLLQKNLSLQERVVDLEDKITVHSDLNLYKELEENLNKLTMEKEKLISENILLKEKCQEMETSAKRLSKWSDKKEQELLGLKHKIIDLTATTEEKLLIGQLHSDLEKCRIEEREKELKIDFLRREVTQWERRCKEIILDIDNERTHFELRNKEAEIKISILQNLVMKQRIQYHGYVPLIAQEIFAEKIKELNKGRHELFMNLQEVKRIQNTLQISEECAISNSNETSQENVSPYQFECQYKFMEQQIKYLNEKIESQEKQLEKLEQELLRVYKDIDIHVNDNKASKKRSIKSRVLVTKIVSQESLDPKKNEAQIRILRNVESQTEVTSDKNQEESIFLMNNFENEISIKTRQLLEANNLLRQKDDEIRKCNVMLDEKKKQIVVLEKTMMELKDTNERREQRQDNGAAGDGISQKTNFVNEQIMCFKTTLKAMQDKLIQKDLEIIKYQTLLKEDRDKHSLAAANLHQELTVLQKSLTLEQQKTRSLEQVSAISRQKSAVVDKYVTQVRELEKHLAELHTRQAKLESQFNAAQQEAIRWRQMAQERLIAMQELGKSLNEQHKKELSNYKTDYEKLRELSEDGVSKQQMVSEESTFKYVGHIDPDILKLCREKDEKIEELYNKLRKVETVEKNEKSSLPTDIDKEALLKEIEVLKKRCEAVTTKEKNARNEIKELKDQLSKRTQLSARTKQSEKSTKEQLQRKINQLEKEMDVLNDRLSQQISITEKHKLSASEDFEKWKKQKYWQENCEKYKTMLQQRENELQKLQQTCAGYRMLIERLEREKLNLESRIKSLKCNTLNTVIDQEVALLKSENNRLGSELATLQGKMEIRQQGAGVLGAALLQEKLEAQERKIAVLELSAKGTVEVRNELERLQTSLSNLQKSNLCLEAENLELKMDLEKHSKETPHLQEQIQHLENYIELLKKENQNSERLTEDVDDKKVSQLERTVFILKRVVEKLQVENKRLHSGRRPLSEKLPSEEKFKREYLRLKDQNTENVEKIKDLELKLISANKKIASFDRNHSESRIMEFQLHLDQVKEQLANKTMLLDKVKTMLHGAATREKRLLKELHDLKRQPNTAKDFDTIEIPSPIEEVSEENSDI